MQDLAFGNVITDVGSTAATTGCRSMALTSSEASRQLGPDVDRSSTPDVSINEIVSFSLNFSPRPLLSIIA
jgi:hypothetical protein